MPCKGPSRQDNSCCSCPSHFSIVKFILLILDSAIFVTIFATLVIIDCFDEIILDEQFALWFNSTPQQVQQGMHNLKWVLVPTLSVHAIFVAVGIAGIITESFCMTVAFGVENTVALLFAMIMIPLDDIMIYVYVIWAAVTATAYYFASLLSIRHPNEPCRGFYISSYSYDGEERQRLIS